MTSTIAPAVVGSSSQGQTQVQSVQREAQQAEQTARRLRNEADAAQRSADKEQQNANGMHAKAADASATSNHAQNALAAARARASNIVAPRAIVQPLPPLPFVNAVGQRTGKILSEIA